MSEQQNTQQPVAAQCRFEGEQEWNPCTIAHHLLVKAHPKEWPHYETRALFTELPATPVPRDVLMEFGVDVLVESGSSMRESDLAAIADRYASQVRPELPSFDDVIAVQRREVMQDPSNAYMVGLHNGMAMMDANYKNSTGFECLAVQKQPEPVNQQLLEALKLAESVYRKNVAVEGEPSSVLSAMQAAIAAEAVQPDHIVDTDKMMHAVPYELNCDDIERLRIALSWEGYSTPEGLEQCAARWPELVRDLIRAVLSRKKRAQQPASAQPVAVPEGWQLVPKEPTPEMLEAAWQYHGSVAYNELRPDSETDAERYRAMLSAAQKPEGV